MKKGIAALTAIAVIVIFSAVKVLTPAAGTEDEIKPVSKFAKKIDLDRADNLMIVAHPDDETIWGGDHLIEENYLVVCITCGTNRVRDNEIRKALAISDDQLIKLGYPDNPGMIINDWSNYKEDIIKDLEEIMLMHSYDKIVTHNPDGEYGHLQHILSNRMVTAVAKDHILTDKLYYFAKYYKKGEMDLNVTTKYPIKHYDKKMYEMVKVYRSQISIVEKSFGHVLTSENWQKYTDFENKKKQSANQNVNF